MKPPIIFALVIADGHALHVIGPGGMGDHAREVERIARALIAPPDEPPAVPAAPAPVPRPLAPADALAAASLMQREQVRAQGFTGDLCDRCGAAQMVRTGTCLTCTACGTTSGGCA